MCPAATSTYAPARGQRTAKRSWLTPTVSSSTGITRARSTPGVASRAISWPRVAGRMAMFPSQSRSGATCPPYREMVELWELE